MDPTHLPSENQWPALDVFPILQTPCPAFSGLTLALENALGHYGLGAGITGGHCWPRDFRNQLQVPNWLPKAPELPEPGEAALIQLGKAELAVEAYETVCFVWLLATRKKKQQRKEKKIWIIGVEGKPNDKHICMCFCREPALSRAQVGFLWFLKGKASASSRNDAFFFSFQTHSVTMGGSRCQSWSMISPTQSTISFTRFCCLIWRLAGLSQRPSWPSLTLGWVVQQA